MDQKEVEFYYGILKKRVHWMTKVRDERNQAKQQGQLFHIEKVAHPNSRLKPATRTREEKVMQQPKKLFEVEANVPNYEAWKRNIIGEDS
mmetsp:Transcript_28379/g.42981  ORF Transcript_28379/g.42981 Transcript_28379/m.42981 type:complete len:90 (+) Transcript_28379:143-412(+)